MNDELRLRRFLPYRCNNLAEKISVSLSRIYVEEFGVSIPQWRILATLAEDNKLPAKRIGELTNMDKVRVSRAVSSLVEDGLLVRQVRADDNRSSLLRLSARGRRLYRRIVPKALAWEQSLVATLSAAEQRALFRLLDKLDDRVEALSRPAEGG